VPRSQQLLDKYNHPYRDSVQR